MTSRPCLEDAFSASPWRVMFTDLTQCVFHELSFDTLLHCHLTCRAWDDHLRRETVTLRQNIEGIRPQKMEVLLKRYPGLGHALFVFDASSITEVRTELSKFYSYRNHKGRRQRTLEVRFHVPRPNMELDFPEYSNNVPPLELDSLMLKFTGGQRPKNDMSITNLGVSARSVTFNFDRGFIDTHLCFPGLVYVDEKYAPSEIRIRAHEEIALDIDTRLCRNIRSLSIESHCRTAAIRQAMSILARDAPTFEKLERLAVIQEQDDPAALSSMNWLISMATWVSLQPHGPPCERKEIIFPSLREFILRTRLSLTTSREETMQGLMHLTRFIHQMPLLERLAVTLFDASALPKKASNRPTTLVSTWRLEELYMLIADWRLPKLTTLELDILIDTPVQFHGNEYLAWRPFIENILAPLYSSTLTSLAINIRVTFPWQIAHSPHPSPKFYAFLLATIVPITQTLLQSFPSLKNLKIGWMLQLCKNHIDLRTIIQRQLLPSLAKLRFKGCRLRGGFTVRTLATDVFYENEYPKQSPLPEDASIYNGNEVFRSDDSFTRLPALAPVPVMPYDITL